MVVDPDGPPCPCGRRGCWERYASGSGLAHAGPGGRRRRRCRRVVELAGGDPRPCAASTSRPLLAEGDAEALAVIDEFARWVALGLVNLTNALDPAVFVLGGGLAAGADLYLGPIERWFGELLYQPAAAAASRARRSPSSARAGAIGAALLATL